MFSVVFHFIMWGVEGQEQSWITGLYRTLTVMGTLGSGLEAGRRGSERWEVEVHLLRALDSDLEVATFSGRTAVVDESIASVGVSGVYYALPRTPVQPFLQAGTGVRTTDLATLTGDNLN